MKKLFAFIALLVAFLPGLATAGGVTTPALPSVDSNAPVAPPIPTNSIAIFGGRFIQAGWSLVGNPLGRGLSMAEMFGTKDNPLSTTLGADQGGGTVNVTRSIVSVWSWDPVLHKWIFYSPQLSDADNKAYADSRSMGVLSAVAPGQGFWVNVLSGGVYLPKIIDLEYSGFYSDFANLQSGWNLLGASQYVSSASEYNRRVVNGSSTNVSGGSVPVTNMRSLWIWEPGSGKWAFYSPVVEQLANGDGSITYKYASDYGYWDATYWNLNAGQGFWVNKL